MQDLCTTDPTQDKHVLDHANYPAPTRTHELDPTDPTDPTDHKDQEYYLPCMADVDHVRWVQKHLVSSARRGRYEIEGWRRREKSGARAAKVEQAGKAEQVAQKRSNCQARADHKRSGSACACNTCHGQL